MHINFTLIDILWIFTVQSPWIIMSKRPAQLCTQHRALSHWNTLTSVFWERHGVMKDNIFTYWFYRINNSHATHCRHSSWLLFWVETIILGWVSQHSNWSIYRDIIKENCLRYCLEVLPSFLLFLTGAQRNTHSMRWWSSEACSIRVHAETLASLMMWYTHRYVWK